MVQSSHETTYGKSTVQHLKDKARSEAQKVESELQEAAHSVADQGREVSENVQAVANNMKDALEKSMRRSRRSPWQLLSPSCSGRFGSRELSEAGRPWRLTHVRASS